MSEHQRLQLLQHFEGSMGQEVAAIMMELLPPAGWGDVATRAGVDNVRIELHGEIAELRGEMYSEFARVRGDISELRGAMYRGFSGVDGKFASVDRKFASVDQKFASVRGEITELRGEITRLDTSLDSRFARLERRAYLATVAGNATILGVVLAVLGLS